DIRIALEEAARRARADHCVEIAAPEHRVERVLLVDRRDLDLRRQVQRYLLDAPRLVQPAAKPSEIRRRDPILAIEQRARPQRRSNLILGNPDLLALQVFGPLDAAIR